MSTVPLHLFVVLLLSGLRLHLLHLDGVGLPPPHVQLMVSHTQRQDALVDPQPRRVEHKVLEQNGHRSIKNYVFLKIPSIILHFNAYWSFFVDGLDDKFLVVEGNVPDLAPGEADLWRQPVSAVQRIKTIFVLF